MITPLYWVFFMAASQYNSKYNSKHKVLWVIAQARQHSNEITSDIASIRLRCLLILKQLSKTAPEYDFKIAVCYQNQAVLDTVKAYQPDLILFGKLFSPLAPAILKLQSEYRIALDICDDIFSLNPKQNPYTPLFQAEVEWIASSEYLQNRLATHLAKAIYTVSDVIEYEFLKPLNRIVPTLGQTQNSRLKLVWFGNLPNINALIQWLQQPQDWFSNYTIVTQLTPALTQLFEDLKPQLSPKIHIQLIQWSFEAQLQAIQQAHISLLPQDQNNFAKAKTANRLLSSLCLGVPVVAQPIPSYDAFSDYCTLRDSISEGLHHVLATPWTTTVEHIIQGQEYILEKFSINQISHEWLHIIHQLLQGKPQYADSRRTNSV